jgi:hypothetical protein
MIRRCFKDELKFHGIYLLLTNGTSNELMKEEGVNRFNTFSIVSSAKNEKFKLTFLTENKLWTLLDQNNQSDLQAKELLCDKTTFCNFFDLWPQSEQSNSNSKKKKHPASFRKMLMVFNPISSKMRAFQINSARVLSKPGNEHFFRKPFEGV